MDKLPDDVIIKIISNYFTKSDILYCLSLLSKRYYMLCLMYSNSMNKVLFLHNPYDEMDSLWMHQEKEDIKGSKARKAIDDMSIYSPYGIDLTKKARIQNEDQDGNQLKSKDIHDESIDDMDTEHYHDDLYVSTSVAASASASSSSSLIDEFESEKWNEENRKKLASDLISRWESLKSTVNKWKSVNTLVIDHSFWSLSGMQSPSIDSSSFLRTLKFQMDIAESKLDLSTAEKRRRCAPFSSPGISLQLSDWLISSSLFADKLHSLILKKTKLVEGDFRSFNFLHGLTSIHFDGCTFTMRVIQNFPSALQELKITNCFSQIENTSNDNNQQDENQLQENNLPSNQLVLHNLPVGTLKSLIISDCPAMRFSIEHDSESVCFLETLILEQILSFEDNRRLSPEFIRKLLVYRAFPGSMVTEPIGYLQVANCESLWLEKLKLDILPFGGITLQAPKLKELELQFCSGLFKIDFDTIGRAEALEKLTLKSLTNLTDISYLPDSLKHLHIDSCSRLRISNIDFIPIQLETFYINNIDQFYSIGKPPLDSDLSPLPQSLRFIEISNCSELISIRFPIFYQNSKSSLSKIKLSQNAQLENLWGIEQCGNSKLNIEIIGCPKIYKPGEILDLEYVHPPILPEAVKAITIHAKDFQLKDLKIENIFGLRHVTLSGFNSDTINFTQLPLKGVNLSYMPRLEQVPNLSEEVTSLSLANCYGLTLRQDMMEFPSHLIELNLSFCTQITSVSLLPKTVKHLNLIQCTGLTEVLDLPNNLETLSLSGCHRLVRINVEKFPGSMTLIDLRECRRLKKLPIISGFIQILKLGGCSELEFIQELLPDTIKDIDFSYCSKVERFPSSMPKLLRRLNLFGCTQVRYIGQMPYTLVELKTTKDFPITGIDKLQEGLVYLNLEGCKNLESISNLPDSVRELHLASCNLNMRLLSPLPKYLQTLHLPMTSDKDIPFTY